MDVFATSNHNKIHLVIGPSSSGKSTYIVSNCNGLEVIMAYEFDKKMLKDGNLVVHFNSFRGYSNSVENVSRKIDDDPIFAKILNSGLQVRASVIVCSKSCLIKRSALRKEIEPKLRKLKSKYPAEKIIELINAVNLRKHYSEILDLLRQSSVEFELVDSTRDFQVIDEKHLPEVIKSQRPDYTQEEVQEILDRYHFEYHSIQLPYGLKTKGSPRDYSIFEGINFKSKTVLDVGCGYGSMSFYAEGKGAADVIGTELKMHRYVGGIILKNILDSIVKFEKINLYKTDFSKKFDIVILLNVIHHLPEPFFALRKLVEMSGDVFILEFPTLDDPKFKSTLNSEQDSMLNSKVFRINNWIRSFSKKFAKQDENELPVVGISLKSEDQTFVFSRKGIERYMNQIAPEFDLEFRQSNINNSRFVLIARR